MTALVIGRMHDEQEAALVMLCLVALLRLSKQVVWGLRVDQMVNTFIRSRQLSHHEPQQRSVKANRSGKKSTNWCMIKITATMLPTQPGEAARDFVRAALCIRYLHI